MRENRIRRRIRDDKVSIGTGLPFREPEMVEFIGLVGYDFFFIDGEHMGVSPETATRMVRAANVVGLEPVVRVPRNDPQDILAYLETGASSIVVPHCSTADDVQQAILAAKYPPIGWRGAASGSRVADYGLTQTPAQYFEAANKETMIFPLIEDVEAVEHLAEILAVEGLEGIWIGPSDLAGSMGYPGQVSHPAVQERVNAIIEQAHGAGTAIAVGANDVASARARIEQGVRIIHSNAAGLFAAACRSYLAGVRA